MRYMLMMNATRMDWIALGSLPFADIEARVAFKKALDRHLMATGELVSEGGLAGPEQARMVRAGSGGVPAISAAPEDKEFLAGYWVVDCDSAERAVEIAARVSAAPGRGGAPLSFPVEVRPVMRAPGEEM